MLSYRHDFHAGNFADVFKHAVVTLIIEQLKKKETPFCYIETHAGVGLYDLTSDAPQKNREFDDGICKILRAQHDCEELSLYLNAVKKLNPENSENADPCIRYYPGSPVIARQQIRNQDTIVLCERHPSDILRLKAHFAGDKQVAVHEQDGYTALKAFLPPKQKRGMVLIDPAYEQKDEYERIHSALKIALSRFSNGIYAIWYPLMSFKTQSEIERIIRALPIKKALRTELIVRAINETQGMIGSGLVIINPPWQLDESIKRLLRFLQQSLGPNGRHCVDWLVSE